MPKTNSVPATIIPLWMLAFLATVSQAHFGPVVERRSSVHPKNSGSANVGVTIRGRPAREAQP